MKIQIACIMVLGIALNSIGQTTNSPYGAFWEDTPDVHAKWKPSGWTGEIYRAVRQPDGTARRLIFVVVTPQEYAAGFAALSAARKTAAIDAVTDTESDFTASMDKVVKAFALVTLDEINELRTAAGLPTYTTSQLVQAVKAKYQTLNGD